MCSRVVLKAADRFLVARNMDWSCRFNTNLWHFPSTVERPVQGIDASKSPYSSIVACDSAYVDKTTHKHVGGASDGVNEKGLVVNTLWMTESKYDVHPEHKETKVSMGYWCMYMLDNYDTVESAVKEWVENPFYIEPVHMPKGDGTMKLATQHLALTDESGETAIFEFYKEHEEDKYAKLHITTDCRSKELKRISPCNHGIKLHIIDDCTVMTNSPVYKYQKILNKRWELQNHKGLAEAMEQTKISDWKLSLPGTSSSPDRFARLSYYLQNMKYDDPMKMPEGDPMSKSTMLYNRSIGQAFSLMRAASVPIGYQDPKKPNISSTLWTTVADSKKRRYFYQSTAFPQLLWVEMNKGVIANPTDGKIYYLEVGVSFDAADKENVNPIAANSNAGDCSDKWIEKDADMFRFLLSDDMLKG